jgi:WD40 repeat protein
MPTLAFPDCCRVQRPFRPPQRRHADSHGASYQTPTMSSSPYSVLTTLYGHTNSVNVIRSSPDGKHLASGGDDGTIIIYSTKTWKAVKRYGNLSPVTALAWHPTIPSTIIFGCKNGDVQTVHFKDPEVGINFPEDQSADGLF